MISFSSIDFLVPIYELMDKFKEDDTFLARWLAGELTPQEALAFREHPHYAQYEELATTSAKLKVPEMDAAANWQQIKSKHFAQQAPKVNQVNRMRRLWMPAAAVVLLLISSYFVFLREVPYHLQTATGEQKTHQLPDQSSVTLNANSSLQYSAKNYLDDRQIQLRGEAFFDVQEGTPFVVKTAQGKIRVLGTAFNVRSRDAHLLVACQEGKVSVEDQRNNRVVLQAGERVQIKQSQLQQKESIDPSMIDSWTAGTSRFQSEALEQVADALAQQFGIQIQLPAEQRQEKFTGSFLHQELDVALKMVFGPMGLVCTRQQDGTYLVELAQ